jgi:hypothetical protein
LADAPAPLRLAITFDSLTTLRAGTVSLGPLVGSFTGWDASKPGQIFADVRPSNNHVLRALAREIGTEQTKVEKTP